VRRLPLGVALSTAAHAAAVVWVGTRAFPLRVQAEAASLTSVEIIAVDQPVAPAAPPAAIDVAVLDERPAAAVPAQATTSQRPRGGTEAIVVPGARGAPTGELPPRATEPHVPLMAMRRGDAPRLTLPSGRWDALDHAPSGTGPEKRLTSGMLHESGGGTYQSDQGGFVGKVNADGTVKLTDKPSFHIHLALPSLKDLGRAAAAWYESDKGPSGKEGDRSMANQIQATNGTPLDPGGGGTTVIVPVFAGGFDPTDWLMRRHGQDPYSARKLALLDKTRDERVQIGNQHRAERLALTPQIIRKNLEALWAATRDTRARKQALFELWDECAETGDPAVIAGGEAARRLVIGFIRTHLAAGSADAFTAAELAELARTRHSKADFQPYP
jgi:hypothetical protein